MARTAVMSTVAVGFLTGISFAVIPSTASGKTPVPCGSVYVIERGDTLFKVAERAYADGYLFDRIFKANRGFLPDAGSIEIGDQILVPCLDGTGPQTRQDAAAQGLIHVAAESDATGVPGEPVASGTTAELMPEPVAPDPVQPPALLAVADHDTRSGLGAFLDRTVEMARVAMQPSHFVGTPLAANALPATIPTSARAGDSTAAVADGGAATPVDGRIRFLADLDALPYAGQNLPQGGMITELLTRSVTAAAPGQPVRVTFVANDSMHLEDLLADGAFDVGFPWFKPDCAAADLAPSARANCLAFEFSRPLVEVRFGFYAHADDPVSRIADDAALAGKRLCRPGGRFMSDPDQAGLATLPVAVVTAEDARQCFAMLADGQVDVVQMVKPDAAGLIRDMGLSGSVAEIAALESVRMLHAVAPRSSARGTAYLELINRGLEHLMKSGSWFEVVAAHQSARLALNY